MFAPYRKLILAVFAACVFISVGTSFFTYLYRANHRETLDGSLPVHGSSDTFITPHEAFVPEASSETRTGAQLTGRFIDYAGIVKNVLILFIPLCLIAIAIQRAVATNPKNARILRLSCVASVATFFLGSLIMHSFMSQALDEQHAYANSLVRRMQTSSAASGR